MPTSLAKRPFHGGTILAMDNKVVIAGGGIGGLACALALGRSGVPVTVLEQAEQFDEVGAGVQLGPNAVRVLASWGLADSLRAVAAYPDDLRVRDARSGRELARQHLGATALARFGQPYACVHRADLHQLLLGAVRSTTPTTLRLQARVQAFEVVRGGDANAVRVSLDQHRTLGGVALIGCDGLWSRVRERLLGAAPARLTGHLAYRGLIATERLPQALRSNSVQAWLGARMHVVTYPVRSGEWTNLVAVVHGRLGTGHGGDSPRRWTVDAHVEDLLAATGPVAGELKGLIDAVPAWSLWALHDRPPLRGPAELARGPVALLGDAAHPLRPYLAQGAAMAMEDAWTLGQLVDSPAAEQDWTALFARYAALRWARNARVQRASVRNGQVFHAQGPIRLGRDLALKLFSERLMTNAWLYSGPAQPLAPVTP